MMSPAQLETLWFVMTFVFGASLGSFLNVVLYRFPNGMSLSVPGSHCPACNHPVRWFDNIPAVSYLVLRGRCRHCSTSFSSRYWFIEVVCGCLSLLMWSKIAPEFTPEYILYQTLMWLSWQLFIFSLLAVSLIDLKYLIIPDEFTFFMSLVGLLSLGLYSPEKCVELLLGGFLGMLILLLIALIGLAVYRREAMGMGDVKLMFPIGLFIGWKALPALLFLAATQAVIAVGLVKLMELIGIKRSGFVRTTTEVDTHFGETEKYAHLTIEEKLAIPFGPFLGLAAAELLLIGSSPFWTLIERLR